MNRPPILKGGAREQLIDIIKKYAQPLNVYVGVILVLLITYVGQIPKYITFRANTFLGRLVLFTVTILAAETYSWIYALLMALFSVLCIVLSPRTFRESFQASSDIDLKLVTQKKKWWSEQVLQEHPMGVEEDRVKTNAIQDNSNTSSSTTSSK